MEISSNTFIYKYKLLNCVRSCQIYKHGRQNQEKFELIFQDNEDCLHITADFCEV